MLHWKKKMPLVFVIAQDWILRTAVRAELRERGVDALGMESPDDAGRAIASGQVPSVIVVEGTAELVSPPSIQNLIARVPTVLIASRTERIRLPERQVEQNSHRGAVLYRPVQVDEIVSRVLGLLENGQAA
jgi:hypothetical protein